MSSPATEVDPYAELDNRADASELSEGLRKRMAVRRQIQPPRRFGFPGTGT